MVSRRRNERLESLRAEARALQRNVTRKVARIRRDSFTDITGTRYDPRVESAKIGRYTERQLQSHLNNLRSFMSRKTQFVADHDRRPIPKSQWLAYKRAERNANAFAETHYNRVGDITSPRQQGLSIREANKWMTSDKNFGQIRSNPFPTHNRAPNNIVGGVKSVDKLTRRAKQLATEKHFEKFIANQRKGAMKALEAITDVLPNSGETLAKFKKLTKRQFMALWMEPSFVNSLFTAYPQANDIAKASTQRWYASVIGTSAKEVLGLIEWASDLKEETD